ncbi:MAG TPA: universal stress protein [Acidimicrobiales bacterium]|nr:universal stress protein [Acidimicrobiales bacterium]
MTVELRRLIVGVDGSPNSLAAVEWVAGLARLVGAEVTAVHALGLLERFDADPPVPVEGHGDEIRRRFEDVWTAPLNDLPVPARREMRYGRPADVLLGLGEEHDVDLVVVGTRGLGGAGLLLGSTSAEVAQRCRRPVVVVPFSSAGP